MENEPLYNTDYDGTPLFRKPAETSSDGNRDDVPHGWFTQLSTLLSWVLVPIMMPVYGILLILEFSVFSYLDWGMRLKIALVVFSINAVLSGLCFWVMKLFGIIQDIGLNGRKERLYPYIVTAVNLCLTALYFRLIGAPWWISGFFFGGAAGALVNLVVNFWWKISAHAAGMAGIVALMIHLCHDSITPEKPFWWLVGIVLLTGLLGTSRVWLRRHTLMQVLCGYAVGFCGVWFLMMI